MHFLPENRMCAPPFVTKQRPPIWKILDPPLKTLKEATSELFVEPFPGPLYFALTGNLKNFLLLSSF